MAFRRGRGVLDHARLHARRRWVIRLDLRSFFATIGSRRIAGVFRNAGYPTELARVLADLTTHAARLEGTCTRDERLLYQRRHLPQGAPTSPALANLIALPLDRRLDALAKSIGGRYSRYADDLVISCDRLVPSLVPTMGAIAIDEGFDVQFRKTRVMSAASRQMVTGLVVNERPGLPRKGRKQLEAILTNCVCHGPSTQDRDGQGARFRAHLAGRVAYAEHVDGRRASKLAALFHQISWPDA
jgi:hypothetical protein